MVRFPGCPDCGTTSDAHAITCKWVDDTIDHELSKPKPKISPPPPRPPRRYLPPVITKRALLDHAHIFDVVPEKGSNIRDVMEGHRIAGLVSVFDQFAELNLGKTEDDRVGY